ncbi:MAG: putative spermidine/putrescine transport system permease protein [Solirubrobacteraceae bacterium]|nr:putative spermidine/putrescine transport system permease protein [Solirubrobacteraceae bacterium]
MSVSSAPAPPAPVPVPRAQRRALSGSGASWLLGPPIVFLLLLLGLPIMFLVIRTFTNAGLSTAVNDEGFRDAIPRTLLMAAVVTVLTLVTGTVYALAIGLAPKWARVVLFGLLFLIFWTPLLVRTYGWILLQLPQGAIYWALHGIGLLDQPLDVYQKTIAAYPAMVHVMLPYAVLPIYQSLRQIEPTQLRAARVMGARPWLTLRRVVLPQLKPGMLSATVLVFIMSLGFYITPALLGDPTSPTVAGLIGGTFNQPEADNVASAMSLLLLAVVLLIYALADRILGMSKQWERERA